jgi:hypothetical protein
METVARSLYDLGAFDLLQRVLDFQSSAFERIERNQEASYKNRPWIPEMRNKENGACK